MSSLGHRVKRVPLLLLLLCLCFVAVPAASAYPEGAAADVPVLNVGAAQVDAEGFPTVVVTDRSRSLTVDQIAAGQGDVEITRGRVVAGVGLADYWFGFRLHNDSGAAVTRIIAVDDWFHANVDFYEQTPTGWRETKEGSAYARQPLSASHFPHLEIQLPPGETKTFFVSIHSLTGLWSSGVEVQDPQTFQVANRRLLLGLSLFVGAAVALILYNLFLWGMLRERIYFYYVASATMTLLYVAIYTGFISFILNLGPVAAYELGAIAVACNGAFSILFTLRLLEIDKHFPRLNRVLTAFVCLLLAAAAAAPLAMDYSVALLKVFGIFQGPLQLLVGAICWKRGIRYAKQFVLIYGLFLIGFNMHAMVNFGLLPSNVVTRYGFMFGSLFELIGFSVLLAYRVRALQQEAATATATAQGADAANKAKSDFLATMSHELRTPLNSILGFSDLLRRDPTLSSDQRGDVDIINRSGGYLLGLINQVLDMAKIESGRTVLETAPVDLPLLIKDVDAMMRGRIEAAGLRFVVEVADDIARHVVCDAQKVRQIMLNLLGNSLKFTTEGGVSLRVKTVPDTTADSGTGSGLRLVFEVEDSGAGIPEEQQQRIFEPFVQLRQAAAPGTGLGLSIVREYLRLMGGDVEVKSRVGVGSLFGVSIPVEGAQTEDLAPAEDSRRVGWLAPGQPQWRVLVVEDEPLNRLLLGRLLEEVGFVVAFAEDGAQCLTVFEEFRPHFIWMDRWMPVMDGLEATTRIRQRPDGGEVKIAALTASVFDDQRGEWVSAGIDALVRKPFRESEIFDCMKTLLGVEYVYQEQAAHTPTQPTVDLATELSTLPEALRTHLADALILGATTRLGEALRQIRDHSPQLADTLDHYIQEFNYDPVLTALEAGRSG